MVQHTSFIAPTVRFLNLAVTLCVVCLLPVVSTAQERCRELELQLTEAHFDIQELEAQLNAQAAAARQQADMQERKHMQQVKALRQQVQELLELLACSTQGDGSGPAVAALRPAHPFVPVAAANACLQG